MRLAFAVLYHANPTQLNYLLKQLDDERHDIYLHIDAKSDFDISKIYKLTKAKMIILPQEVRQDIKWGGFSMVRATIALYQAIIQNETKYDYITLLSGQDLFIKPIEHYHQFLNNNNGKEFISYWKVPSDMYYHWGVDFDSEYVDGTAKPNQKMQMMLKLSFVGVFTQKIARQTSKQKFTHLRLLKGSQWTTLTYNAVKYIVEYSKENNEFFESFQKSMCPDELYVQTLIWYSPFRKNVFSDRKGTLMSTANLRRICWNPRIKDWNDVPHTYQYKKYYINYLTKTDAFIGRKFNWEKDQKIIDYVNNNLFSENGLILKPPTKLYSSVINRQNKRENKLLEDPYKIVGTQEEYLKYKKTKKLRKIKKKLEKKAKKDKSSQNSKILKKRSMKKSKNKKMR